MEMYRGNINQYLVLGIYLGLQVPKNTQGFEMQTSRMELKGKLTR